jgi:hypothetical protein
MVLLTCRGSRTGTSSATCGRSRTYVRTSFGCEQIYQDFLSHLSMLYSWLMWYLSKNIEIY